MKSHQIVLGVMLLVAPLSVGCKSLDFTKAESVDGNPSSWWNADGMPPVERPVKIVAIWTNSVFNQPGAGPMRGLGGRVYFYNAQHKPVCVDGDLTVFLYDDTFESDRERQEATKQIKFSAEEVMGSYSPSEFGPSYSFWLPWDRVGGEQTQLSVIPVFTTAEGEPIVGDQARYLLPGKKRPQVAGERPSQADAISARLQSSAAKSTKLQLKSSTITVPPSMQERLRRPSAPRTENEKPATSSFGPSSVGAITPTMTKASSEELASTSLDSGRRSLLTAKPRSSMAVYHHRPAVRVTEPVNPTLPLADSENASIPQSTAHSPHDLLPAQSLQSVPPASARAPKLLDRAMSLFDRSR